MNRRFAILFTAPAVIIGVLLFATCLASAWYINRLQRNMARIQRNMAHVLANNVAALESAQELEIRVRQLRYHCFLYLMDPTPARAAPIKSDHEAFERSLEAARQSSTTQDETACVAEIQKGYEQYRDELRTLRESAKRGQRPQDFAEIADQHPIRHVVDPCQELLRLNQKAMQDFSAQSAEVSRQNDEVSRQARLVMLLVGIVGPISGVVAGIGIIRGLHRSIFRLSVRVQDIAQRLDQDVASVKIVADGDLQNLDRQLQHVFRRVEEVAERMQRHQREMLRTEQLAAVGQLAASVAHEVRNPLTAVKMLVALAVRVRDPRPLTAEDLQVIHGEVARLEKTVQSFLDFARLPTPKRSDADLREVVRQAAGLVQARARQQKVSVEVECPEEPVPAFVDHDQLCTVLVNLCLNALDAMPHGGRLRVTLQAAADGAHVQVADTGPGIAPEIRDRLFTPFTSTKPTGTGLGLSLSRRIVEEHGGGLRLEPTDTGACFTLTLPATKPAADVREQDRPILSIH